MLTVKSTVERSWHIERLRAVVDVLEHMDDEECSHDEICFFLDKLQRLHRDSQTISAAHRYFDLATSAFVEVVSGVRPKNFYDAIQTLREITKQRSQQYKHLYDEIKTMRAEIALHKQIITCLEYRHVLESLPNKDALISKLSLNSADLKDASPTWKHTWRLAVETELAAMLQDVINTRVAASSGAPTATSAPPPTGPAPSPSPAAGPAASTPPPPRLTTLLRQEFDLWVHRHPKPMAAMVASGAPNVSNIDYSDWRSYQRGRQLYGELSTNIHTYGKTYDVNDGSWLKTDALILHWLKPKVSKDDGEVTGVTWDDEWTSRGLPR